MPTDFELLMAWRAGDVDAGAELFERHHETIVHFFHTRVSHAAKDDLVQATFLACLDGAERLQGDSSFRAYLLSIAHERLIDHHRAAHG